MPSWASLYLIVWRSFSLAWSSPILLYSLASKLQESLVSSFLELGLLLVFLTWFLGIKTRSHAYRVSDLLTKSSLWPWDHSLKRWDQCQCIGPQESAEKGADVFEQHCSSVCKASKTITCLGRLHTCLMFDETRSSSYVTNPRPDAVFLHLLWMLNNETYRDTRLEWRQWRRSHST